MFHSVILHIGFQIWISFYLILVSRSVSLHIRISSFSNILSNIFIYSIDCVKCITHVESCKLISQISIQLFLAIMTQCPYNVCCWSLFLRSCFFALCNRYPLIFGFIIFAQSFTLQTAFLLSFQVDMVGHACACLKRYKTMYAFQEFVEVWNFFYMWLSICISYKLIQYF